MSSSRRLIATIPGLGRLLANKKNPEIIHFQLALVHKKDSHKAKFFLPREVDLDKLQRAIIWTAEEYEDAMDGKRSNWAHEYLDQENLRIALDHLYKELARRAK
jgi:hypothetical protein